jgi:Domain of unknown function (DUF5710)
MSQDRAYFRIPFDDKDDAKALGARFDGSMKKWYAPDEGVKEAMAVRWQPENGGGGGNVSGYRASQGQQQWGNQGGYGGAAGSLQDSYAATAVSDRVYFDVPFDGNTLAKSYGARFDGHARKWCAAAKLHVSARIWTRRLQSRLAITTELAGGQC